jgi:hypothetical protein
LQSDARMTPKTKNTTRYRSEIYWISQWFLSFHKVNFDRLCLAPRFILLRDEHYTRRLEGLAFWCWYFDALFYLIISRFTSGFGFECFN